MCNHEDRPCCGCIDESPSDLETIKELEDLYYQDSSKCNNGCGEVVEIDGDVCDICYSEE